MKSNISIKDWQLSWIENAVVVRNKISIKTPEDISAGNYLTLQATVPGEEVANGTFEVEANGKAVVCKLPDKKNGFYLIRWTSTGGNGVNHFVCNIGDGWTWEAYKNCMQKAGFYGEFEGF